MIKRLMSLQLTHKYTKVYPLQAFAFFVKCFIFKVIKILFSFSNFRKYNYKIAFFICRLHSYCPFANQIS